MRIPSDMPRPGRRRRDRGPGERSGRGRVILVVVAIVAIVLITSLRGIAGFYTDYLWFDSVGQGGVFTGILWAKVSLVLLFTAMFFVLLWVNLFIADRVSPPFRPVGPEDEIVARYRALVAGRTGIVRAATALLFALIAGAGTSGEWRDWLLFRNSVDFGSEDPLFHRDIGFYVFRLPFLQFVVGWAFAALVIILIVTAVAHYLNGGIRIQVPAAQRVTSQVKVHLSVLLGLLAIVKAIGYWLQRYSLTTSTRGTVDGALYTDVNAQRPAIEILALIALAAAVLFLLNIRRKGWVLPALGIGIWAIVAVVAGAIVPAAVQRFRVEPSEFTREEQYIVDNIEATQQAIGLANVESRPFAAGGGLTGADLVDNADVVRNIRLWDTGTLTRTYQQIQALRPFYRFNDVDVDRYMIDGELTQVMVAARELDAGEVPQKSWESQHLAFTHGYGLVISPANSKDPNGRPDLAVSDVPLVDDADVGISAEGTGLYFGEQQSGYVIVDTNRAEIDYQDAEGRTVNTTYTGEDGVDIGSWVRRVAFALRFADPNPLFSGSIRSDSRILFERDISDRVHALAPFLDFDRDPYPVVVDGRVQWVIDGYTTTDRYPYGQSAILDDALQGSDLDHRFNYIRNSVKAVVDAYDGTVTLYVVDDDDPIIRAWAQAFPDLFSTEDPPAELVEHFRYPEDLFRVQTNMWGRYHIGSERPEDFFNNVGAWTVAGKPGQTPAAAASNTTTTADASAPPTEENRIDPYYLLTRLPGDEDQSFIQLRPYVPVRANRPNLTAFLVASSDPDDYGRLVSFETPPTASVDGPGTIAGVISSDTAVSEDQTVLCQRGSTCTFGNLVFVPIGNSILFVQPLYITSESNDVPLLRKVIVEYQGQVGYADTLRDALLQIFDQVPETREEAPSETETPPSGEETPPDVQALLDEASDLFDQADAAIREGGPDAFGEYADLISRAQTLIEQARELLAGESGTGTEEGTTTTTTPASTTTTSEPESA